MSMIVKFWGTRGAIPSPGMSTHVYGGNTPCVEIRCGDSIFVCDAGSGIRLLSEDLKRRTSQPRQVHLFLTHLHSGHVQGLPFFDPLFDSNASVQIHSSEALTTALKRWSSTDADIPFWPAKRNGVPFSAGFSTLNGDRKEIDYLLIRSFAVNHAGDCHGLSFEENRRKVVYIPDNELPIQNGDKFPDPKHEALFMRHMPRELLESARGADLLIMDAQFTDEEYASRRGSGHSSCFSVTDFALQAGVRQLALFHHDPNCSDFDLEERARLCKERAAKFGADLTIFPAREGMALEV